MRDDRKRHSKRLLWATAGLSAIAGLGAATPLWAQTGQDPTRSPGGNAAILDEVIVTATRREGRTQDIPIAATVVTGRELEAAGITDTERLAQVVPSLFITSSQQVGLGAQIRMRGVGTATGNPGLEGSVGYFIDGVYVNRSNTAFTDLVDIERVEVLRGPQGTLFGRNTSAGAISVLTREPQFDFGGRGGVVATNDEGLRVYGSVTGPIIEDLLAFSLSAQRNTRRGYMIDVVSGDDYNDRDRTVLRGQLLFEPTPTMSLRLIADYSERSEHSTLPSYSTLVASQNTVLTSFGGLLPSTSTGFSVRDVAVNAPFTAETEDTGFTAIGDWTTDAGNFRAILGYRDSLALKDFDADYTNVDIYRQTENLQDVVKSAELQWTRTFGSVDALAGLYFFDAETTYLRSQRLGTQAGLYLDALVPNALITPALWESGRGLVEQRTTQRSKGWSVFTHNIWNITPRFQATVGLRYQEEDKRGGATFIYDQASACTFVFAGPGSVTANILLGAVRGSSICAASTPPYNADYNDSQTTGTIILSYNLTDRAMAYSSYSRGFKAGGVNLDSRAGANPRQTFLPETVDSYEVGLKTSWFRGAATLNLTAFRMEFSDFQLNSFSPTTAFVLTNEGSVVSEGVELEGGLLVGRSFWVRGGVLYNEASYGDDTLNPNLRGRTLSNAPKWSGTLGLGFDGDAWGNGWRSPTPQHAAKRSRGFPKRSRISGSSASRPMPHI